MGNCSIQLRSAIDTMTRINLIDPKLLTDQHLMAEYRELPMVHAALRKSLSSAKGVFGIPKKFTLGTGHVKFFYNKGLYLYNRYSILVKELQNRKFNLSLTREVDWDIFKDNNYYHDWEPSKDDIVLIEKRLDEKIAMKPEWYRYYGESIV